MFAQLTVAGKWEGPHVFMVRIRDDAMRPVPGVRIKDLGPKMGLNGVDNGQVRGRGEQWGEAQRGSAITGVWGGSRWHACMHRRALSVLFHGAQLVTAFVTRSAFVARSTSSHGPLMCSCGLTT